MTNTYHGDARIGNWAEDACRKDMELAEFARRRGAGEQLLTKLHTKMELACTPAPLTPAHADGCLRYGDVITLHSVLCGTVLAANMDKTLVGEQLAYLVTGTADPTPVGRTAWTLLRPGGVADGSVITYGAPVVLALKSYGADPLLLQTQKLGLPSLSKSGASKKDQVSAVTRESRAVVWKFVNAEAREQLVSEGKPVLAHAAVGLQHLQTFLLLSTDLLKVRTIFGVESEVHAQLSRNARLTDVALPKVYLDHYVPDASKWIICTDGFAPPLPAQPVPTAAPSTVASFARLSAPTPAAARVAPAAVLLTAPTPMAPRMAEALPAFRNAFLASFPFYAKLVSDALDATGLPASEVLLRPLRFGEGVPGMLGGPLGAPAVIVLQEWWGLTPQVLAQASALAASGYRVLVPDLYKGAVGVDAEEAHHLMSTLDFPAALGEIAQAAVHLRTEGAPSVGIIGFCMGGALALGGAAKCEAIEAAVSCYGVNFGLFEAEELAHVAVQAHFGELDAMHGFSDTQTALALERRLHEVGNEASVCMYMGSGHAFLNDNPTPYASFDERAAQAGYPPFDEENAEEAWGRILGFFARALRRD